MQHFEIGDLNRTNDDASDSTRDSETLFTALLTDDYFIEVSTFGDSGGTYTVEVAEVDDDPAVTAVTVQFGAASYTATEGGAAATVEVTLSADPERTVTVPLSVTPVGTAIADDYTLSVDAVTFVAGANNRHRSR